MKVRVGGILIEDGKILLARHRREARRYWTLPGGGVEEGETIVEALHREWLEEIGMKLADEVELKFIIDIITPQRAKRCRHLLNLIFEVRQVPDHPRIDPHLQPGEHLDATEWVSLEKLAELKFVPSIQPELLAIGQGRGDECPLYLGNKWIDIHELTGEL